MPRKYVPAILSIATAIEGILVGYWIFQTKSLEPNARWFGLSTARFAMGAAAVLLSLGFFVLALLLWKPPQGVQKRLDSAASALGKRPNALSLFSILITGAVANIGIIVAFSTPLTADLISTPVIYQRLLPFLLWATLFFLQTLAAFTLAYKPILFSREPFSGWIVARRLLAALAIASTLFQLVDRFTHLDIGKEIGFHFYAWITALLLSILLTYLKVELGQKSWAKPAAEIASTLLVFTAAYFIYISTAESVNYMHTPAKAYFNDLADAFLKGRLYLEAPDSTMDLTFYNGKWYVAFPPLAALLMLPLVAQYGPYGFSTVVFTITFASISIALIYRILQELSKLGWSQLRSRDNLWLVMLFGLGTIHWYMSIAGKVWYISRILTVTFFALATFLALNKRHPLWIGAACGIAMQARPNIILLWPFLLGIYAQHLKDNDELRFAKLLQWSLLTAIPIAVSVAGLLGYNYLRFGDFRDFGYATMNVGGNVATIQAFGQFNPAFILYNLKYMLWSLPYASDSCGGKLAPNPQGISIFVTTPALIYLVRAFRRKLWVAGAWLAVFLQVALLSMHTGAAWEFGYRFVMDFMIPLVALLAIAAGKRVSGLFKALILAGVVVNYIGVLWYFGVWCPA